MNLTLASMVLFAYQRKYLRTDQLIIYTWLWMGLTDQYRITCTTYDAVNELVQSVHLSPFLFCLPTFFNFCNLKKKWILFSFYLKSVTKEICRNGLAENYSSNKMNQLCSLKISWNVIKLTFHGTTISSISDNYFSMSLY